MRGPAGNTDAGARRAWDALPREDEEREDWARRASSKPEDRTGDLAAVERAGHWDIRRQPIEGSWRTGGDESPETGEPKPPTPFDVECPYCKAKPGAPCIGLTDGPLAGTPRNVSHGPRDRAWMKRLGASDLWEDYPGRAAWEAKRSQAYRCIRCEKLVCDLSDSCPKAPDSGPHETLDVRPGHSLHELGCPRANPSPLETGQCTRKRDIPTHAKSGLNP